MTEAELVAIEERCAKVRYAEGAEAYFSDVAEAWVIRGKDGTFYFVLGDIPDLAKFWAESATTIPALVAEVRRLREAFVRERTLVLLCRLGYTLDAWESLPSWVQKDITEEARAAAQEEVHRG